ncbi:hypothetical protein FJY71_03525 [candidate division WOR-3 bacterium]|nr:hypothetical protein [candidate division WOR-3 bacterium]
MEEQPALTWRVHRARESPVRTAVTAAFILAFVVLTGVSFSWLMALVAFVVLFTATHSYFLPIEYTFSGQGIEVDKFFFTYRYEWSRFRRWFRTTGGIVLSPFSRRNFLDNFRGVHLLLPKDDAAVVAYLERRFAPPPPDDRLKLNEPPAAS